jgi:hypothetical protein
VRVLCLTLRLALLCLACAAFPAVAEAQMVIRFVASYGNDANDCTRTRPCRTLQRGIDATPAGSELQVLDSGSYGPTASITKSITISAEGVTATVFNPAATSTITVNNPTAVVVLRGLTLSGGGTGQRGLDVTEAAALYVERCEFEGFSADGIRLNFADTSLYIKHSVARTNGSDGLLVNGNGTTARVTVEDSRFENNGGDGMDIDGIQSVVTRTVTSGNGSDGIEQSGGRMTVSWTTSAQNLTGFNVGFGGQMTLEYVVARGNTGNGLSVSSVGGTAGRISNSVFTNNGVGIANSGTVETRQNNTVADNTTDLTGNPLDPLLGT